MNQTLAIIKTDAVTNNVIGAILKIIEENNFKITHLKKLQLTKKQAEKFYAVHSQKPFFQDLIDYMTEGEIVAVALSKENAVENFRELIGDTDPQLAQENTIRKSYGTSKEKNAIHGSDSDENAQKEIDFFFSS